MELESTDLAAITGCDKVRLAPYPHERRRHARVPVSVAAPVYPLEGGEVGGQVKPKIHARVREISLGGVGLLAGEPLPPGQMFVIGLPRKKGKTLWMYCKVMRCQPASNRLHMVGALFAGPVRAEELRREPVN